MKNGKVIKAMSNGKIGSCPEHLIAQFGRASSSRTSQANMRERL